MNNCLTKKLPFKEVSGCLVEKPECGFAHKFGFSLMCRHPDHTKFQAHDSDAMTINKVIERYDALRIKRRNEFIAGLDEESRKFFCLKLDFNDRPLKYVDPANIQGAGLP
jgi:hypothetical protein